MLPVCQHQLLLPAPHELLDFLRVVMRQERVVRLSRRCCMCMCCRLISARALWHVRRLVPLEMGLARAAAPHAAEAARWRARRRPHAHILEGGLRGEGVAVRAALGARHHRRHSGRVRQRGGDGVRSGVVAEGGTLPVVRQRHVHLREYTCVLSREVSRTLRQARYTAPRCWLAHLPTYPPSHLLTHSLTHILHLKP